MKLTTRGRYGLVAMGVLKDNYGKGPISLKKIATEKGISEAYLEQLFSELKKNNLIRSIRGAQGGYELSKPPQEISIGEILKALEGEDRLSCCKENGIPSCGENSPCSMKYVLDKIQNRIDEVTASINLSEL